jgi:hypothetical protein
MDTHDARDAGKGTVGKGRTPRQWTRPEPEPGCTHMQKMAAFLGLLAISSLLTE